MLAPGTNPGEKLTETTRGIADASPERRGVFTVDWDLPPWTAAAPGSAPPSSSSPCSNTSTPCRCPTPPSNAAVPADVIGRAYEYPIRCFADPAGAKAGEFFTPPEVVDALMRVLEPKAGDAVFDPTCGSGGMLVHSADFLRERGHDLDELRAFGQGLNWRPTPPPGSTSFVDKGERDGGRDDPGVQLVESRAGPGAPTG